MKKLVTLFISMLLIASFALPVFAASDINAAEQSVLDKLAAGVTVGTKTIALSTAELNLAKNFFMRDEINLTTADVAGILTAIDQIGVIFKNEGVSTIPALSAAGKANILALAKAAVEGVTSVELTFEYNSVTKMASILGVDNVVLAQSDVTPESTVIKYTGFDFTTTLSILALLAVTLAGGVILAKKKKLAVSQA